MQQDHVDIIYEQSIRFYASSLLDYIYNFLPSTIHNQTKPTTEIYNDPLASNFYSEVIQL